MDKRKLADVASTVINRFRYINGDRDFSSMITILYLAYLEQKHDCYLEEDNNLLAVLEEETNSNNQINELIKSSVQSVYRGRKSSEYINLIHELAQLDEVKELIINYNELFLNDYFFARLVHPTPSCVSKLAIRLMDIQQTDSVADFCCGERVISMTKCKKPYNTRVSELPQSLENENKAALCIL